MINSLNVSRRRRLPFFRTDLELSAELAVTGKQRELFRSACLVFRDELPGLTELPLQELSGTVLTNLRGHPEQDGGGESREETLLLFEGVRQVTEADEEITKPFSLSVTSRFLDFKGKDIRYEIRFRTPAYLGWETRSLSEIFSLPEVEPRKLSLCIDRFVPRVFSFLGNKLPVLKETFSATLCSKHCVELSVRDLDYDREKGLSPHIRSYIEAVSQLGSEANLQKAIENSIASLPGMK